MTSEMKKFYQMTVSERRDYLRKTGISSEEDLSCLAAHSGPEEEAADKMIENVIGTYTLPMGLAQHFLINGRDVPIPMVIEEPSVVAAASNGARLARFGGGFAAEADAPCMIGQIQLVNVPDMEAASQRILDCKSELMDRVRAAVPRLTARGGGPVDIEVHPLFQTACGPMLIVHLILDVRDAMGANAINTALESISQKVAEISGAEARLRILSNLADRRLARASCRIPLEVLAFKEYGSESVRDRILEAAAFAEADPYRAVTHNKGILNGIDAVALATGNDWRAVESGAHAWASVSGVYRPLSHWTKGEDGSLMGTIELPLAVGTVGGATHSLPAAVAALRMMGVRSAPELAGMMAAVGLAQNLAALKALATEGIQRGHMSLHAKQLALSVGASANVVEQIAEQMIREDHISATYAAKLFDKIKQGTSAEKEGKLL